MANTLMFEVGIKQAVDGLDKVKKELDQFITDYTKKMQIQVDIKDLQTFITALKSIGNGDQLKPLLAQVERLQNRLAAMTDKGQYFDMLRGEATAAAEAVKIAEKYLESMKKTGNVNLISNARTNLEQAQIEAKRTADVLASATERFAKEEANAAATTADTKQKIDALSQSVGELHTKVGSGININLSGDFANWAKEVQAVTASVKELVEQLQKMHNVATTSANVSNEALLAQAKAVEDLRKKLAGMTVSNGGMLLPKVGVNIEETIKLQDRLDAEQQKFNEMLTRGSSVAGSYAEVIQQLGQKYSLTAEQAQKLAAIISNGTLERGNVQQGLRIGYNTAGDIVETINALQKLHQEENKPTPQGSLFDQQQFKSLQEAIDAVIREINRLKEAFAGIGEIRGMTQLTESMNILFHNVSTFKDVFSTLSSAVNLTPSSEYVKKLQTDFEAAQAKVQELTEKLTALAAAQNNVAETASKAGKSEKQIGDSQAALFNRYNKLLADIQNIEREALNLRNTLGGNNPYADGLRDYIISLGKIRTEVKNITSSPSVADAITKGMSSEQLAKLNSALAALKTNFKEVIADAKDFNKATDKGSSQAEARIRKLGMAFNELKNYMKANGGSEEMRRLQSEIQVAIQKMRQLMNAGNFAGAINVYERLSGIIRQAATATKEFERSQQGVSSSVSHANANLQQQSQILTDLKSMAMQYLSVWGAQSFINNIIELGGQLEQQRLSIGAILQDTAQANYLFGQIKDLAIKSPFGVQQLDAMSKQLSAYGFQYSELYEWTKRLADISAATGTSVDRLALALGHVRAEGALSGYTLRQFSMGNIPLLQKLSENLGKTKQEIRKMTRAKEIGYEDVLNVLKQLTDEGGMFYEAQETMAQALNAKFKNLRDSFQIMYSEMAEGAPGDFLKGVAEVLTDISKSWRVLMPVILSGGAALGVWKLSTMALNHELERSGKLLVGNAIATSKYSMNQLRAIATTGRWTTALHGLGRAMMSIGKFIFNPVTLGFAAVEGLIYLWSKHNDEVRKAADLTKAYGEAAVESEKNISKQLEKIKPFSVGMDDSSLKAGIDSMIETVKNYAINGQGVINQMMIKDDEGKIMSLAEKYKYLRNELEETKKVYKELNKIKDAFEYGINTSDSGWFDDNVETNLTKYANAYKKFIDDVTTYNSKYGDSIEKAITNAEKSDSAFREATKNLTSYGEKLAVFWSNPDKYKNAFQYMNNLFGSGAGTGDALSLNESFFNYVKERDEAMNELDQFIENTEKKLKEKGYDFSKDLAPEQVGALLKMSKDWLDKHPEWENIYDVIKGKLKGRWGIEIVPDVTEVEEELPKWLEDLQKELDKTGIKLTANMSMEQIVDEMKKAYDKAQTTINKLGPIAMEAKIDIKGLTDENIEKYKFLNPELYETLKGLKSAQDSQSQITAAGNKRGLNFNGMRKDGSHKNAKEKQNTEAAKAVRERVRVIKEAADAFQYWREKVGDKGAWEHVQKEFGDVLAKIGITADNIEDVRAHLNRIPQMKEYKAITDKKVKTEIDKEIAKENDQFIRKDFERDTERFLSRTQIELDNLTRAWETFNSVREATGDLKLAIELSGAEYVSGQTQNLADAIKKKIEKDFASFGSIGIPFNINFSDREIKEKIESAMPQAAEEQIAGLIEEYKKWRDLQRDVLKRDINTFAKLVGSAKDYDSQLERINDELEKQIEANERLVEQGVISQKDADKANEIALLEARDKAWKASVGYSQLFNNSLALTRQEIENGINLAMDMLNEKMQLGLMTAQEYADEMAKIRDIQSEWTKNAALGGDSRFWAGAKGGLQGISQYNQRNLNRINAEIAVLEKRARSGQSYDGARLYELREKRNKGNEYKEYIDSLSGVFDKFDALSKALDPVISLFDKLGMSVVGEALGIGKNALNQASAFGSAAESVISGAGPYGAAIGAGLSIASGLFGMFDAALQEEIDASKARQQEMENLTKNLEKALERTLGGVYRTENSSEDRRKLQEYRERYMTQELVLSSLSKHFAGQELSKEAKAFYAEVDKAFSKAQQTNSYYDTQRAFLYAQRYELQKQLSAEKDKKNSDDSAIADYKQQLAELEDQIKYFALDMAKALYDIDIQSWASDLTDAIVDAWENGEDAAEAYANKVKDLMKDLTKNILTKKVMEKAFENAGIDKLIADMMDVTSGKLDYTMVPELAKALAQAGQNATDIITRVLDELERQGYIDKGNGDSSGSVTSGIKSITEQTADLLASYINSMRADLSVNRAMIAQYFPLYYAAMTSGNQNLRNIENHTAAIMRSNDTIADKITSLDNNITGLRNNVWRVPVS